MLAVTFTRSEAAQVLGLSVDSVDRLICQGRLPRLAGLCSVRVLAPGLAHLTGISVTDLLASRCAVVAVPSVATDATRWIEQQASSPEIAA